MPNEGNEGDEILLLAFRQIECKIPGKVTTIDELTPEMLVEIVARSLFLISDGEVQISHALPPNIASRHRICTTLASKVKDVGFAGDCGYNQLLYPVEQQTRALLNWIVQRLPRSQEERAEEALGANAALNKRVIETLDSWRQVPFKLHICATGTPARNIYSYNHFRTVAPQVLMARQMKAISKAAQAMSVTIAPSILELNAIECSLESNYADLTADLDADIDPQELRRRARKAALGKDSMLSDAIKDSVRSSIASSKMTYEGSGFTSKGGLTFGADYKDSSGLGSKSLQDLMDHIGDTNGRKDGSSDRGSRFLHAAEFSQENELSIGTGSGPSGISSSSEGKSDETKDEDSKKEDDPAFREAFLEELRSEVQNDLTSLDNQRKQLEKNIMKLRLVDGDLKALMAESDVLEKEILLKRKILEMLPNAAENIEKLQNICAASGKRLMELGQEWETHRRALIDRLRKPKGAKTERKLKCKKMVDEMKQFREEMQGMIADLKEKQDRSQALKEELDKLPRNLNRNLYTFRIMDIIAQVGKQDKEIEKIVNDIHGVQKDINQSNASLQRADAIAEEKIYSAASAFNSDPAMTDTYRHLKQLRSNFEALVGTVEKIGQQEKTARVLETKIDQEKSRVSANNFERITKDLAEIKKENSDVIAQIKAKKTMTS